MANDYQIQLAEIWEAGQNSGLPTPWKRTKNIFVGGIYAAGLTPNGKFPLTVSHSERGLFDCITGEKVARDYEYSEEWLDRSKLLCQGIGPIADANLRVVGSFIGGGFPHMTPDYWSMESIAMSPGKVYVWAESSDERDGFEGGGRFFKLWEEEPPFGFGFSENGSTAVVAARNEIRIWHR